MPFDQSWKAHSTITLLGDADHIVPPSGAGVNLAMLDAWESSESLTDEDFTDTQTAIATYEGQMRARAAAEEQDSLEMVEWMHGEEAVEKLVQLFNGLSGE